MISYCTTCKGRRWQLEQVLFDNLCRLKDIDAEWIIFDYHCPDQLLDNLMRFPLFSKLLEKEKVKIYRLTEDLPFDMPLAKNAAHVHAIGDIVFNLDADNFIGISHLELEKLKKDEFLWISKSLDNGTCGRIGLDRNLFLEVGGYNTALSGAGYEDIELIRRLLALGKVHVKERGTITPVQNTRADTLKYISPELSKDGIYEINREKAKKISANGNMKVNPSGLLMYNGFDITDSIIRLG